MTSDISSFFGDNFAVLSGQHGDVFLRPEGITIVLWITQEFVLPLSIENVELAIWAIE